MLIGRKNELDLILKEIQKPATSGDVKRIIAVNGIFGVGKSTLLREVIAELQTNESVDAVLYSNEDAHIQFLPEFVYQLINSFRACKAHVPRYKSDETDSRWMRYRELHQELQAAGLSDPEISKSPTAYVTDSLLGLSDARREDVLLHFKHRTADERRLMTDTAAVVCETILVDLMNTFFPLSASSNASHQISAGAGQRKIVIVIDTYEKMTLALNKWLLEHFLLYCYIKRFGDFRSYNSPYISPELFVRQFFDIRFVIAGREPLRSTDAERRWDRWSQTLLELRLQQFNTDNIKAFIREEKIEGVFNVDEVLNATAGLPYLVSLWSQSFRRTNEEQGDETMAAHAQERIFWYKTPEQIEWIRSAAFCEWFDADVLRCFASSHKRPAEAYAYLRRTTEITRESTTKKSKLELLPIVRESIRTALHQESPEIAHEYETIVATYYAAHDFLQSYQLQEAEALRYLAYSHRFDIDHTVKELWPDKVSVVESLLATSPELFERAQQTISLRADTEQLLLRYNSYYDQDEYASQQQKVSDLWSRRASELTTDLTERQHIIGRLEKDLIEVQSEIEKSELNLRDGQTQLLELESQIRPLRESLPVLATNRDSAAARIAFVASVVIGAGAWYTPELIQGFEATPDMIDSVQKILYAFTVAFALLFSFFLSRSIALRSRRALQRKNRIVLSQLEETHAAAKEKLNENFTQLEAGQRRKELLEKDRDLERNTSLVLKECMSEPYA